MNRALPILLSLMLWSGLPLGAQVLIEDFTGQPETRWSFFTDQVMGGVSTGRATLGNNPPHIHLAGDVSTANNGGFIQVRLRLRGLPEGVTALRLTTRGDGQQYFLHVRTDATGLPWQYYQAAFTAPPDWSDVEVPLSAFKGSGRNFPQLRPGDIRSIALVAYGRDHVADLRVSRISAE